MQEKVKNITEKVKERWKSISKKMKILLGAGLAALIVALIIIGVVLSNKPYATLFTGLNQSDMTGILNYLSEAGITDYKVQNNNTILVPQNQEPALKSQVLMAGYPSSGYGYDTYFDHVGSLTTESERNQLVLYGLQDRMAAVICDFPGVVKAGVILTPGEDNTYVLDSGATLDASASVTVTMEEGKMLTDGQAQAIRNLVSRGLKGLNVENVEIADTNGNIYAAGDDFSQIQDAATLKLELEEKYNDLIRTRIMQVLLPLYGEGNVKVSVNTVVNVDRTYTDSTDYNLEDWADGNEDGIIGTQIWDNSIVRNEGENAGGVVGTGANADLNTYVEEQAQPNGTETAISTSGQTDHLVDTTKQQVEHLSGYIADVMVSVTINEAAAGNTNVQGLYDHVGRAAGIVAADQAEKISILVSPFYQDQINPEGPDGETDGLVVSMWMIYAAIGGGVLFILLLVLFFVLHRRRAKKRRLAEAAAAAQQSEAVEAEQPQQTDIMELQTEKSMELRQDIRKFAEDNPEIAAQMVKNWLREGET